jgi:hypothetical protein
MYFFEGHFAEYSILVGQVFILFYFFFIPFGTTTSMHCNVSAEKSFEGFLFSFVCDGYLFLLFSKLWFCSFSFETLITMCLGVNFFAFIPTWKVKIYS